MKKIATLTLNYIPVNCFACNLRNDYMDKAYPCIALQRTQTKKEYREMFGYTRLDPHGVLL